MHFVIDALGISKLGGGRTAPLLQLSSVFKIDRENFYTVIVEKEEPSFATFRNVEQHVFRMPNRFAAHLSAQVVVPAVARAKKASLVHHVKHLCTALNPCPYIVTINDLTISRMPWTHSWIDVQYYKTVQRFMVQRAKLVLAPSLETKRDLGLFYGINSEKVRLIPYAASTAFEPKSDGQTDTRVRARYGINSPYILFVGILALKKNLPTLIRAFQRLKQATNYAGKLVIVGRQYPQSREKSVGSMIEELGLREDVILTGPVPDEHLPAFYRGADVFAYPSIHEGFGIVVLEAMACGTPVIASGTSSLPEVVGDAGLLIPQPLDGALWADALHEVLYNTELRRSLKIRGLERSQAFSWERIGKATLDCYLEAARKPASAPGQDVSS